MEEYLPISILEEREDIGRQYVLSVLMAFGEFSPEFSLVHLGGPAFIRVLAYPTLT